MLDVRFLEIKNEWVLPSQLVPRGTGAGSRDYKVISASAFWVWWHGGYDSQMHIWIQTWMRRSGIRPCPLENPGLEWGYGYQICNMDFILYIKVFIRSTVRIWPRVY